MNTVNSLLERTTPEPNTGCWLWLGNVSTTGGYGLVSYRGRVRLVHRVIAGIADAPRSVVVRHRCDQPLCINPAHLLVGDRAENSRDALRRGLQVSGERHPWATVTNTQVSNMRARAAAGETCVAIARSMGLTTWLVQQAVSGKSWKWIDGHAPVRRGRKTA